MSKFWFMVDMSNSNENCRNYGWLHTTYASAKKQFDDHRKNFRFSVLSPPKLIKEANSFPSKSIYPNSDDFNTSLSYFNAIKEIWAVKENDSSYVTWFETRELAEEYIKNEGLNKASLVLYVRDFHTEKNTSDEQNASTF